MRKQHYAMGAALTAGMIAASSSAYAEAGGGNNFSNISKNIATGISDIPGLFSALAYLFGIMLAVLGIMKIKDHVENPGQTPLKDGAVRLLAGGALFAIPIVSEAMFSTIGEGEAAAVSKVNKVELIMNN
jgi:hypothetical protein